MTDGDEIAERLVHASAVVAAAYRGVPSRSAEEENLVRAAITITREQTATLEIWLEEIQDARKAVPANQSCPLCEEQGAPCRSHSKET